MNAYPKTIKFGPVELEGFMMPDGSFRQGMTSTGKAIGGSDKFNWLVKDALKGILGPGKSGKNPAKALQGSSFKPGEDGDLIVPVKSGVTGQVVQTINIPLVIEIWKRIAISGNKYSAPALELLGLSAIHSLERVYQEAFGVEDERSTSERLTQWALVMDAGKHFPLFGNEFSKHFARITGRSVGYDMYAAVCLAELVYHRLPEPIYVALTERNKVLDSSLRREHTHSQFMTDEMKQEMRQIVAVVTNQMANTEDKADDPKAYSKLLRRLDKTLPRFKTRGGANARRFTALEAAADRILAEERAA